MACMLFERGGLPVLRLVHAFLSGFAYVVWRKLMLTGPDIDIELIFGSLIISFQILLCIIFHFRSLPDFRV